jgi:predicted DNA-binding transcriptional regulator AlpA
MSASKNIPFKYFVTREAAEILGLSRRTLEKHRTYGTGPRFLKLGGRVVYKIEDLNCWAECGGRISTAQQEVLLPARRHSATKLAHAQELATAKSQQPK